MDILFTVFFQNAQVFFLEYLSCPEMHVPIPRLSACSFTFHCVRLQDSLAHFQLLSAEQVFKENVSSGYQELSCCE